MAENTTVGPAGGSKSLPSVKKPDNHTPTRNGGGFNQGRGAANSDVNPGKADGGNRPIQGR